MLVGNKLERRLKVATWIFSGLCSDRKQKEDGELLAKHNLYVVAGQESWEKEGTRIDVEIYIAGGDCSKAMGRGPYC